MLIPAAFSFAADDGNALAFAGPAVTAIAFGVVLFFFTRSSDVRTFRQDVFLIVVLGWLGVATLGASPFVFSGVMGPVDAFFESMAGFTTTGASTVEAPEDLAPSLLLWRSMTQWTGGVGIVVLFVAVAPLVGFGATQLYTAEVATPVPERLTPRIRDTAKLLAYVYLGLTLGGVVALLLSGMSPFDAVNYALATVSTGGFATHADSVGSFESWAVELFIVVGMVLSGINFALYVQAVQGRVGRVFRNRELLAYLGMIAGGTILVAASLYAFDYRDSLVLSLREALFQTASLLTGTGFSTTDWQAWDPLSQSLLLLFMAIGGMAGSTAGGLKVIRVVLLARNGMQEAFRMVHPQAITPLRLGDRVVPERLRTSFLGFFFVYVTGLGAGTLLMALHGLPTGAAFGSVYACLNITGTALSPVGDAAFYAGLPATAKLILTGFMLLGRLELFTVLVLLTPAFWRG
jgi:trk/ktr system potassium uptake protein